MFVCLCLLGCTMWEIGLCVCVCVCMCVCVCVCVCLCVCVRACVCVCVSTTHPDFGLPVQDGQEAVQEVCNEDWLVVGSRVKCHKGHSPHTVRRKGKK